MKDFKFVIIKYMILELNFKKGFTDENGKKHRAKSLVLCENEKCGKTRIIPKSSALKYESKYCQKCLWSFGTKPKKGINDYKNLELKSGFKLIGDIKTNIRHKTKWICPNGHSINMSYQSISDGRQCLMCSKIAPKKEIDYINLAAELNIEYIGPYPKNTHAKTNWRCECGEIMEKSFTAVSHQKQKQCLKCSYKNRSGKNSPLYNPYITQKERERKRFTDSCLDWKRLIRKKFNNTCEKCKMTHGMTCVHHIFNWADYPNMRENINNGVILCLKCHKKFHNIYGIKYNNLYQLDHFLNYKFSKINREDIIKLSSLYPYQGKGKIIDIENKPIIL